MGVVEGAAVSLVMERDMGAWKIGFDSRLLAAAYSVSTYVFLNSLFQVSVGWFLDNFFVFFLCYTFNHVIREWFVLELHIMYKVW